MRGPWGAPVSDGYGSSISNVSFYRGVFSTADCFAEHRCSAVTASHLKTCCTDSDCVCVGGRQNMSAFLYCGAMQVHTCHALVFYKTKAWL